MTEIGLGHYLSLGAIIFFLGVIGIFLNRKNIHYAYSYSCSSRGSDRFSYYCSLLQEQRFYKS